MRTRAAVLWNSGEKWSIEELELSEPDPGEITIKVRATGLCHSDDHNVTGDYAAPLPLVGGHEAAGEVVAIGPGVDRFAVGDRVVTWPIYRCGHCRFCSEGRSWLCDGAGRIMEQAKSRLRKGEVGIGQYTQLGTFSEYTTIFENQAYLLPTDIPFEAAALVGCGVSTGYGAAVRIGQVAAGDAVVVVGVGGVGTAAIQGARIAGASKIIAVDPVRFKLDQAVRFGATHTASSVTEAIPILRELSWGVMAEVVVVTVGVMHGEWLGEIAELVGKGGKLVMTSVTPRSEPTVTLPLSMFSLSDKSLIGNVAGNSNPSSDFSEIWRLYRTGQMQLLEMITKTYTLDNINDGYNDLSAGTNVRGLVVFE
jgi:NDMA-dependent alcohol dehydrogenase